MDSRFYTPVNSQLNPLESRERHIIREGTEILGGVLLTRAGIVVDVEENPDPYQDILDVIDKKLAWEEINSNHSILKAIHGAVDRGIPYSPDDYKRILKNEAKSKGLTRLSPDDEIGLSRFISVGGKCHQHALLSAAMLRLLQERGDIGGKVSLESTKPNELHPDRHTRMGFSDAGEYFTLGMDSGLHLHSPYLPVVV